MMALLMGVRAPAALAAAAELGCAHPNHVACHFNAELPQQQLCQSTASHTRS